MLLAVSAADLNAATKTTWKCRPDGDDHYFVITQIKHSDRLYLSYMTGYEVPVWTVSVTMTETGSVQTFWVRYGSLVDSRTGKLSRATMTINWDTQGFLFRMSGKGYESQVEGTCFDPVDE